MMPPTNANGLSGATVGQKQISTNDSTPPQQLRPPLYNAEDYATALRGLFTHALSLPPPPTSLILEHSTTNPPLIPGQGLIDMNKNKSVQEMSMKKFINGSELLFKLEADLRSAYPSFVQEFVCGESDGVACILDALRNIHEALDHVNGLREQRKLVLDERSCVQCVCLMMRNIDALPKLLAYAHGLYPIVHCTVSTNTSTRVLALEILTNVCEQGGADAYAKVSEAISTLRLRLGEPIRCKVLVGAISSASAGVFQATGIRFLRSFVASAPSPKYRVYLQVELEDAGFNVEVIRKSAELSPARESRLVIQEIDEWDRVCIDVDTVVRQNSQLRNSVATLQQEIATLKDKIKKHDNNPHSTTQQQKYTKKKHQQRALSSTPIQTIVTPVDSEEEAEQIHQILEDLHNIVNNELLQDSSATTSVCTEIVPVLQTRELLPPPPNRISRPTHSEPNLFESEHSTVFNESDDESSPRTKVKHVVQQLEQSNLFNTLPNFNTSGLASKFANFKSTKLTGNQWGENEGTRVKSLENLDNFTLKWKYPVVGQENETPQPSSLMVLQDYRMNRFSKGSGGKALPNQQPPQVVHKNQSPSSSGLFSKNKKRHVHPQKTFQISLVSKNPNGETKMTNLNYNDLGAAGGGVNGKGDRSPPSGNTTERVTDLPSGMY
ncbi:unnamed protein product [Orchesella dallaii]|uniref:GBD/FH3 domain-containing protein n=1 Tax=Orchesella dallaii TaxID=48710 RepID=A0ABP1RES5_9HEXA